MGNRLAARDERAQQDGVDDVGRVVKVVEGDDDRRQIDRQVDQHGVSAPGPPGFSTEPPRCSRRLPVAPAYHTFERSPPSDQGDRVPRHRRHPRPPRPPRLWTALDRCRPD